MSALPIRIQKAIAQGGLASRRKAERLILAGEVKLNGDVVRRLGTAVIPGKDILEVAGKSLRWNHHPRSEVWALYKPKQCVTTLYDPQQRLTVKAFFPRTRARLVPIGRLDYDAEGLLLLTNDGTLAHQVAHPAYALPKTYLVKVRGLVLEQSLARLAAGPRIDSRRRAPVRARVLHFLKDKTWLELTLKEGVYHHIKKMFLVLGHRVIKIKRYQIGPIALEALTPGASRLLRSDEVEKLREQLSGSPKR